MASVGLVAEGTNDFPALKAFLERELPAELARPLVFIPLQPHPDATTGKMGGGGWGRVVGWCRSNSGENIRTFFNPLFAGDPVCDVIVVQIDGDAVHDCSVHSPIVPPQDPADIEGRTAALHAMVDQWLALPDNLERRFAFAFPHLHTEAWIMAGLEPNKFDWETIATKDKLRKLKPGSGAKSNRKFYELMAILAANQSTLIAQQCVSYRAFLKSVSNVSTQAI